MPQQTAPLIEANFSQGFKTEFTGLNFPENAVTDTQNCIFERIGNVTRRAGINYETNFHQTNINRTNLAINYYKWKNVGGDGSTQVFVKQVGSILYFYRSSTATIASPLSNQALVSTVNITSFLASGGTFDATVECQFTDGNGYLFVFHPKCDPFYCTYTSGTITAAAITVQIRDFPGVDEAGIADNLRPTVLTDAHHYNLYNQGWTGGLTGAPGNPAWSGTATFGLTVTSTGVKNWNVAAGLPVLVSEVVSLQFWYDGVVSPGNPFVGTGTGTVNGYTNGPIIIDVTSFTSSGNIPSNEANRVEISYPGSGSTSPSTYIDTWHSSVGGYPSNADVWWRFKNTSDVFAPGTTVNNVTLPTGPAPKGYYILTAFDQKRTLTSGVANIADVTTTARPRTGTWFQGRIWYTGADASTLAASGFYTWTENLYFSQIIEKPSQFGMCYQTNDPTSQDLFDLLPSDGGVITIQGTGSIYKLFPVQNGMLVFAANGIWFITGSQGIGFAANDYTITKISNIQSISSNSFVDVQGYPIWWNEEGIYKITPSQSGAADMGASRGAVSYGALNVEPITFTTIQTFYQNIPLNSKKYVKGDYNYLDWVITWTYRSTEETTVTSRYEFDSALVYNTATQAFAPWTIASVSGSPYVHGVAYIQSPGGSGAPDPTLKYLTSIASAGSYLFTFSEENDTTRWVDWHSSGTDRNYTSYFTTGYKLAGKSFARFQSNYINVYVNNYANMSYRLQGIWDFAINRNSNKYTALERTVITDSTSNFSVVRRRHRIRGRGMAQQFKVTSVNGAPFDIIGWSVEEKVNQGL